MIRAHDSMKVYYDRKTQTPVFTLGDKVWLDAPAMEVGKSKKLRYLYRGPYYICDELQNFTYQLRRCEDNTLLKSPVHANRLKRFYSPKDRLTNPTRDIPVVTATEQGESDRDVVREASASEEDASDSEVSDETNFNLDDDDVYRVKRILAHKKFNGTMFYKIHWEDYSARDATWEPESNIPKELIREYMINKTLTKKNRKKSRS